MKQSCLVKSWDNLGPIQLCWECGEQETEKSPLYTVHAVLVATNGRMIVYDLRDPENVKVIGIWEVFSENWQEQLHRATSPPHEPGD